METVFELLGIENKELQVSNLLSYYLDPKRNQKLGLNFLNSFCKIAEISPVSSDDNVEVKREVYLPYGGYDNYIDILICIGNNSELPDRIICIENKINSSEGIMQTKRYYESLENKFKNCPCKDYIYLTKNNSAVDLTSIHFRHLRYSKLGELLSKKEYMNMPLAMDFYNYYIKREENLFRDIEKNDLPYTVGDKSEFIKLIDYIVWKINVLDQNKYSNIYCIKGKSSQSNDYFYQISMHNWEFELLDNNIKNYVPIIIHIEGKASGVPVHMETNPYTPYNKIQSEYSDKFFDIYVNKRNELRDKIGDINSDSISISRIRGNAYLTIAKFEIKANTFKEYFEFLMKLVSEIDTYVESIKI